MTDWEMGFISGVGATIIGFVLTMLWDVYKFRRDTNDREASVMNIVKYEIEENRAASVENSSLLENENSIIDSGRAIIPQLLIMKSGYWSILIANTPKKLLKNVELLEKIQSISLLANHINEEIRSRQIYKDTNSMMTNFCQTVKLKNNAILANLGRFNNIIDDVLSEIQQT